MQDGNETKSRVFPADYFTRINRDQPFPPDYFTDIDKFIERYTCEFWFSDQEQDGTWRYVRGFAENRLIVAVRKNRYKFVKLLIDQGDNVNYAKQRGATPLIESMSYYVDCDITKILLENGADVNHETADGRSALDIALQHDQHEKIELLIRCGLNVKESSIEEARRYGRVHQIRLLENVIISQLFSKLIANGILCEGIFREFLADGVCDARILIHIASFAYCAP